MKTVDTTEVYTVEEVEPGVFQSVFPTAEAEKSSLHTSSVEAWAYVREVAANYEWPSAQDATDPDNFWIDEDSGERVNAATNERSIAA